ncbi:hypothetical protein WOLCODRAFT_142197 [Wolfiporia cocos MD-104 SS10]|uniref:Mid2 domain-containing protein n=1 Tax=Wolfiporia cocos (strain MD-104) TaxID=742152 RepID=A0A2H3JCZ9_WOLCO|nr:hypothetical protein WOLCODRAFT_142197 [Wolfiporia cocos MD-104 SS10]
MSCYSVPAATEYATVTTTSAWTSFSNSITSWAASETTVQSCYVFSQLVWPVTSCTSVVPEEVTMTFVQVTPTATHYSILCSGTESQAASTTPSPTSSPASVSPSPAQSTSAPSASSSSATETSSESHETSSSRTTPSFSSTTYTTVVDESTVTTLPDGTVVSTQFIITETVTSHIAITSGIGNAGNQTGGVHDDNLQEKLTGPIIGAIVGGIIALVLLAFIIACLLSKKRKREQAASGDAQIYSELMRKGENREEGFIAARYATSASYTVYIWDGKPAAFGTLPSTYSPYSIPASAKRLGIRSDLQLALFPVAPRALPSLPIRQPQRDVVNRTTEAGGTPPLPSKAAYADHYAWRHHTTDGYLHVPTQPQWVSPETYAVAGPSTVRMPEPYMQPVRAVSVSSSATVRQGPSSAETSAEGPSAGGSSSIPPMWMSKAREAAAERSQSGEQVPPPAYAA